MEVHAHTHNHGKKTWKAYFWEFLMLFLAVFCGFLAENQREHMVEHERENKYMASLVEDLENDTIEIAKVKRLADSTVLYADSTLNFMVSYKPSNEVPIKLGTYISQGGRRISLIITDRTSSQLKNSGAMRLIRNKQVADGILRYWNQNDQTAITIDRYSLYRNMGREILFKLWVIPDVYIVGLHVKKDSLRQMRVIDQDTKKWDELTNLIAISRAICQNLQNDLEKEYKLAADLIALIKKEYHFH